MCFFSVWLCCSLHSPLTGCHVPLRVLCWRSHLQPWVLVAGVSTWDPPRYPNHDVRAFVEEAEALRSEDALIIVYPSTRVAYPIYSAAPVTITRSDSEVNGSVTTIDDPTIVVLTSHRDDPPAYRPELDASIGRSLDVWFVASHFRDDIDEIIAWAVDAGFAAEEWSAPTARLFHWTR